MIMKESLNELAKKFHKFQIDAGFTDSNVTQRLMLVVSEVSEAFEAYRKGKYADIEGFEAGIQAPFKIEFKEAFEDNIKDSLEDEIADSIIRLLAFCGENNIDIEKHVELKYEYNQLRGFKYGGKKF